MNLLSKLKAALLALFNQCQRGVLEPPAKTAGGRQPQIEDIRAAWAKEQA